MLWNKKGVIFKPDGHSDWMSSHAQVPIVENCGDKLQIYFGSRDKKNQTRTALIDIDVENFQKKICIHNTPVLSLGKLGTFDDSGVMPSWIVDYKGLRYLYYIGWNKGLTVPYRNSIGLAISDDGKTFVRRFDGPIMDRTIDEPYMSATPCVIIEAGIWRMWYLSGTGWKRHAGHPEPYYNIKYAESVDGILWKREGHVCIDFKSPFEGGIARPSVIKDGATYRMWYSYRGAVDYRTNTSASYRIGYAESKDGLEWIRKDEEVGIDLSQEGWDSEMICYPFVKRLDGKLHMFYNGNGFGRSGIGYAVLEE